MASGKIETFTEGKRGHYVGQSFSIARSIDDRGAINIHLKTDAIGTSSIPRANEEGESAEENEIATELRRLSIQFPRYGFKQMYLTLRRNGVNWNHLRVLRVYRRLGLDL